MKYLVKKESLLFKQLLDMKKQSEDADEKCSALTKRLGFNDYFKHPDFLGGGLIGFFSPKKKLGYYNPDKNNRNLWFPLQANKVLISEINSLPKVSCQALNSMINYKPENVPGMPTVPFPKIVFSENFCLISIPEWLSYEPVEGMEEIVTSMYKNLMLTVKGLN